VLPTKLWIICVSSFRENFDSFGQAVSEEKTLEIDQAEENYFLWQPCLETDRDEMSNLDRRSSKDVFYQISVHL
jgi:hypothetical protein